MVTTCTPLARSARALARTLSRLAPAASVMWVSPDWDGTEALSVIMHEFSHSAGMYFPAPECDAALLDYLYSHGDVLGAWHDDQCDDDSAECSMMFRVGEHLVRYQYTYYHY